MSIYEMGLAWKPDFIVFEQQSQTSLHIHTVLTADFLGSQTFRLQKILALLCSWAGWFKHDWLEI